MHILALFISYFLSLSLSRNQPQGIVPTSCFFPMLVAALVYFLDYLDHF